MLDFKCVFVVMTVLLVQNSVQVPVRTIPENELTVTEGPVYTYVTDPLENIGVELTDGELIEGDIRVLHNSLPKPRADESMSKGEATLASASFRTNSHQLRNSVTNDESWVDKIIPYEIDPTFNSSELQTINAAIANITASVQNCIEFVPRQNQEDYIYITGQLIGCWSDVGKKGGSQNVSISRASGCVSEGIIMHELMHALGFWHEHTRLDRDNFITIIKENIRIGCDGEFRINPNGKILVSAYDYYSIMHYKTNQFSKSHLTMKTIQILQPGIDESKVGQRERLSEYDVQRIMALYNCQKYQRSVDNEPNIEKNREQIGSAALPTENGPSVELIVETKSPSVVTYQTKRFDQGNTESLTNPPNEADVGRK